MPDNYFENCSYNLKLRDFPGGPVVKTLPSNAGGAGSVPGRELRSHIPRGQKKNKPKHKTEAIL